MALDFEVYEILHTTDTDGDDSALDTYLCIRVFGEVDGKSIDFDNEIIAPPNVNTPDEISDFLIWLLQKYYAHAEATPIEELAAGKWLSNLGVGA